jgi:hypothetical protein
MCQFYTCRITKNVERNEFLEKVSYNPESNFLLYQFSLLLQWFQNSVTSFNDLSNEFKFMVSNIQEKLNTQN